MPNEVSLIILGMINVLFIAGSCVSIALVIRRWSRGEPLAPFAPRNALDIGGVFSLLRRVTARIRGEATDVPSPILPGALQFWSDVRLGIVGFLVSFLPMILIHLYCQLFVPYEHAAITAIKSDPSPHVFFAWAVAAVVQTPILEELIFRNLLQGVLEVYERMIVGPSRKWIFGAGPIFLSSLAFALMHWDQGAAAIPLFLFALVLGYLYFQTHRLTVPIVAHAALNLFTMINLWFMR